MSSCPPKVNALILVLFVLYVPCRKYAFRFEEARSIYPSEVILDRRPLNSKPLSEIPVENLIVFLSVLKLPTLEASCAYDFSDALSVSRLILAPKAAAPFVDVPTPRCT